MTKAKSKFIQDIIDGLKVDGHVPSISEKNVNEFKIGKNYFYKIINADQLISVQKRLNFFLLNNIPINRAAVAFRNKFSYLNLFEPHKKNYFFLRLDIRSFFHSININDIEDVFSFYFDNDLLKDFINIVSYELPTSSKNKKLINKRILPMGFVTSPAISNVVFRKIDIQIQKLCLDKKILYTRYADDMVFSSEQSNPYLHSIGFINEIKIIVSQLGLKINAKKTLKSKHTLSLNGYIIQNGEFPEIRISNKKTKIIKKLIYMYFHKKSSPQEIQKKLFHYQIDPVNFRSPPEHETIRKYYKDQLKNKVAGYRSYFISIIKFNNRYSCTGSDTINTYSSLIDKMDKIIQEL